MPISRTIRINAPPAKVWAAMTDVERWPDWAAQMQSLRRQDAGQFGKGSRVTVTPKMLTGSVWTVTAYDEGTSYTWETTLVPGVRMSGGHVVEAAADGTNATFWLHVAGPIGMILSPVLGLVFRRNTRLATQGLKSYCEKGGDSAST